MNYYTQQAILAFGALLRAEARVTKAENSLRKALIKMPRADADLYARETEAMQAKAKEGR